MSELKENKKHVPKQHAGITLEQPLPIPFADLTGVPASNSIWKWYTGTLSPCGSSVTIRDEEACKNVSKMGYFGCFRSSFEGHCVERKLLSERTWKRRGDWASQIRKNSQGNVYVANPDTDDDLDIDSISVTKERNPLDVGRVLQLSPEEAFFLSYALGCLIVKKDQSNQELPLQELWTTFSQDAGFPFSYAAYHFLRAKGWVVRPGFKYGVNFLLYKHGPPFYHATYTVLLTSKHHHETLSWLDIQGLMRLALSVGKDLLLCRVSEPSGGTATPEAIKAMEISFTIARRWVSSSDRLRD